jgi:hypothetical protein
MSPRPLGREIRHPGRGTPPLPQPLPTVRGHHDLLRLLGLGPLATTNGKGRS